MFAFHGLSSYSLTLYSLHILGTYYSSTPVDILLQLDLASYLHFDQANS